jgi:hypothetical protein
MLIVIRPKTTESRDKSIEIFDKSPKMHKDEKVSLMWRTRIVRHLALGMLALGLVFAIYSTTRPQYLRITNIGTTTVKGLVVLGYDPIEFGDVPAGATTEYKKVSHGVYGCACYQFEVDGQIIIQPLTDMVGEIPLTGKAFTYTIDFDFSRSELERIRLISVTRDY